MSKACQLTLGIIKPSVAADQHQVKGERPSRDRRRATRPLIRPETLVPDADTSRFFTEILQTIKASGLEVNHLPCPSPRTCIPSPPAHR